MDKSPLQNENRSSIDPELFATENAVVKNKMFDDNSLAQKQVMSDSEKDKPSSDEQALEDSWLLLSQDWQTQPYEKADIQALLRQTKKRTLLAKLLLVIDMIATLALIVALMIGLYQGDWGSATIAYLTFGSVGSLVFVYYEIKIRLRIWQHCCDSPDKAIANAISGIESSIRYITLVKLSCYFILPAVNWYIYAMIAESGKSPWQSFVVINSFITVMWLLTHWFHLKRKRELSQLCSV